jgi:DivIVA domain-containing protein
MVRVIWLWALVTVGVIGAIAVVAAGHWGSMVEVDEDRPDALISAGALTGQQIKDVRFTHSVRGYRQDEVDTLLDLVATELDRRESMLRQANINLDQTVVDGGGSHRGTHQAETTEPEPDADADADQREETGYPWDDNAGYGPGDPDGRDAGRTADPPVS